ncbi:MAG TPA: hypothetical protein VHF25_07160 [Nitriliruptorales bacterium]|nr:hypothetical protein [Nitriliruptorales bacterium]
MPDDDHGDPRNITNRTFQQAADAVGQEPTAARSNTQELLEQVDLATGQKA